jgi:hypothetical protein
MNTNTEHEQPIMESPPSVSGETEHHPPASSTTEDNSTAAAAATSDQPPAVEERTSSPLSWFSNLGIPPNLTNQLTNISSSIIQVTSKVSAAANTLVQKSLPQRPVSPNENEQTEVATKHEEGQQTEQNSEENTGAAGINKDLTSKY